MEKVHGKSEERYNCLMKNHFHLVVETPEGNLVAGMRWLMSTYQRVKGVKPYICPFLHLPPCFFCGRIDGCHVKYAWSIPERSITS